MLLGSKFENSKIECKRKMKLLGITIYEKLIFTKRVANNAAWQTTD